VAAELSDGVGDGDVGTASGGLLSGGDLEDTVDVDLENDLKDGLTSPHRWDRSKSELPEGGVVLAVDTLSLVDGELHSTLVVRDGGECALLQARNGVTTRDDGGEDVTLHGNTEGKRDDIQKKHVLGVGGSGLAREDTSLDRSAIGDSLIGVNALLELLAVEEVGEKLLDARDTGGTTDQDDLVNLALVNSRVLEDLLDRLNGSVKGLRVDILEPSTRDVGVEVLSVEKTVNLHSGLSSVGQSPLGTLASSSQTSQSTWVSADVFLGLLGELLLEVIEKVGVEILSTQVSVSSGSLDGEDTTLNVKEGHIESSSTEIVDEDVSLLVGLSGTETVGDSGGGRLVDDTEDVKTSDGTGILGGLTLVVVEVSRDGDDGLGDLLAELDLSNLFHLAEDHGGDLLGGESLGLVEVLDLDAGVAIVANNLEWPRLNVLLDGWVIESPTDETLDIENGVDRVHSSLVLGGLTDQSLLRGERDERRGGEATLLVGDYFYAGTLIVGHT